MQDSGKIQAPPLIQFLAPDDNKQAPCLHKLCYFADLNGDGILEIIAGERQGKSGLCGIHLAGRKRGQSTGKNVRETASNSITYCRQLLTRNVMKFRFSSTRVSHGTDSFGQCRVSSDSGIYLQLMTGEYSAPFPRSPGRNTYLPLSAGSQSV